MGISIEQEESKEEILLRKSHKNLTVIHMSLTFWAIASSLMSRAHNEEVGSESQCGGKE